MREQNDPSVAVRNLAQGSSAKARVLSMIEAVRGTMANHRPVRSDLDHLRDLAPEQRWPLLLVIEPRARQIACEGDGKKEELRDWWAVVSAICTEYAHAVADGRDVLPPAEMMAVLGVMAGDLSVGRIPKPVSDSAKRGRSIPNLVESRDIGLAVAYCLACRPDGYTNKGVTIRIIDPKPIEQICDWFGIGRRTAQQWMKDRQPVDLRRNALNEEVLVCMVREAADRYRDAGRSFNSITRRQSKRSG